VLVGAALAVAIISAIFLWPSGNQPDQLQLAKSKVLPEDVLLVSVDEGTERHVYVVSASDGKRDKLIERDRAHGPVISPHRDEVIYLIGSALGTPRIVAADGRGDRPILTKRPRECRDVGRVAWSPADPILALVCLQADGSSKIALVQFPDGELVKWLPTSAYTKADDPAFSTDGTRIAYWANKERDSTSGQLFICSTHSGGTTHRLMLGQGDADPVWSPDDNTIAFSRDTTRLGPDTNRAIFLVGSNPRVDPTPTPLRAKQPGLNDRPVWSPDGTQVAFVHTSQTGALASTEDLWIVNVQDGKRRRLNINADRLGRPSWR
jgi:Tol biopolymer transport system component